jgi:WD40 repeat protein
MVSMPKPSSLLLLLMAMIFCLDGCKLPSPVVSPSKVTHLPSQTISPLVTTKIPVSTSGITSTPIVALASSTSTQSLTVEPMVNPTFTIEPVHLAIAVCGGKGQISSPPDNFGITGTIVYQIDNHKGLYTIGGTLLTQGKIVDQQQDVNVYEFSPDGNWLAYANLLDFAQDKIVYSTPVMILLKANGERIEQRINITGLEEELQKRCVGCEGYHFWGSFGEWINNSLMQLYLGATDNFGPSAYLPKFFEPWSGIWQDQWFEGLPDLYTITPIQGGFHRIQLSPDLSRTLYPAEHGGITLWDNTQGTEIWSDSQFENDYGEYIEWSPDSEMVAAVNNFYQEKHRLLLITRDGEVTELVNASTPQPDFYAGSLSWSPDSRYLAFTARTGNLDQIGEVYLYLYDTQTKSYVYRCPLPGINDITNAGLVWSPDGQWIAYQEQPFSAMRLLNVQTGEITELLDNSRPIGWSDTFPVEWP